MKDIFRRESMRKHVDVDKPSGYIKKRLRRLSRNRLKEAVHKIESNESVV